MFASSLNVERAALKYGGTVRHTIQIAVDGCQNGLLGAFLLELLLSFTC